MSTLQSPSGSVIQASGGLEARLLAAGWIPTNQPAAPGVHLITAADLAQLAATLTNAVAASQADRADLRQILEPIADELPVVAAEVDDLVATVEATTTAQAPKPTPRTDALEAWRSEAEPVIDALPAEFVAPNDPRLTDARTPTSHTHPAAQVTGLANVATSGSYNDLANKPSLNFDPSGSAATAQAAAVQRGNHTGTQAAATITGLHAVATSGDYNALANKPSIPAAVNARQAVVSSAALTANTAKTLPVSWGSAMPNATYAVSVTVEHATPNQFNCSLLPGSRTTTGCSVVVRSTAAVSAPGVNVHVIAVA